MITFASALAVPAAGTFLVPIFSGANTRLATQMGLLMRGSLTWGSGGTTIKAFIQSSGDEGTNWHDIACFAFTTASKTRLLGCRKDAALLTAATPTDGTLTDDTSLDGLLSSALRMKCIVAGTYAASTLTITGVPW